MATVALGAFRLTDPGNVDILAVLKEFHRKATATPREPVKFRGHDRFLLLRPDPPSGWNRVGTPCLNGLVVTISSQTREVKAIAGEDDILKVVRRLQREKLAHYNPFLYFPAFHTGVVLGYRGSISAPGIIQLFAQEHRRIRAVEKSKELAAAKKASKKVRREIEKHYKRGLSGDIVTTDLLLESLLSEFETLEEVSISRIRNEHKLLDRLLQDVPEIEGFIDKGTIRFSLAKREGVRGAIVALANKLPDGLRGAIRGVYPGGRSKTIDLDAASNALAMEHMEFEDWLDYLEEMELTNFERARIFKRLHDLAHGHRMQLGL